VVEGARPDDGIAGAIDAVVSTSRVLVALAARALAQVGDDLTLPQFRMLVVLAEAGPQTIAQLAAQLDVHGSTATRMCTRLAAKQMVSKRASTGDRREVLVTLRSQGGRIVDTVARRRQTEIATVVARLSVGQRRALADALTAFADAAARHAGAPSAFAWPAPGEPTATREA
jgi:DNA-binding MarR family transcriptional regulator